MAFAIVNNEAVPSNEASIALKEAAGDVIEFI